MHSIVTHSDVYVTVYIDSFLSIFIQVIPRRVPIYGLLHFKGTCHDRNMRVVAGDFLSVAVMLILYAQVKSMMGTSLQFGRFHFTCCISRLGTKKFLASCHGSVLTGYFSEVLKADLWK